MMVPRIIIYLLLPKKGMREQWPQSEQLAKMAIAGGIAIDGCIVSREWLRQPSYDDDQTRESFLLNNKIVPKVFIISLKP